jgi:hypothetical protein
VGSVIAMECSGAARGGLNGVNHGRTMWSPIGGGWRLLVDPQDVPTAYARTESRPFLGRGWHSLSWGSDL